MCMCASPTCYKKRRCQLSLFSVWARARIALHGQLDTGKKPARCFCCGSLQARPGHAVARRDISDGNTLLWVGLTNMNIRVTLLCMKAVQSNQWSNKVVFKYDL